MMSATNNEKTIKRSLIKLSIIIFIVLFLAYVWVPYRNKSIKYNESFKGIVLRKYYQRGNTLDVKLESNQIHTTNFGLNDSDFDKISIGDTVEMRNGEFIGLK